MSTSGIKRQSSTQYPLSVHNVKQYRCMVQLWPNYDHLRSTEIAANVIQAQVDRLTTGFLNTTKKSVMQLQATGLRWVYWHSTAYYLRLWFPPVPLHIPACACNHAYTKSSASNTVCSMKSKNIQKDGMSETPGCLIWQRCAYVAHYNRLGYCGLHFVLALLLGC